MSSKNVELARKVRELTRRFPAVFYMGEWLSVGAGEQHDYRTAAEILANPACGTTACFAGWTCLLSGYTMDLAGFVYRDGERVLCMRPGLSAIPMHAETVARELLGINDWEASRLFYATALHLDSRLAEIFGEEI